MRPSFFKDPPSLLKIQLYCLTSLLLRKSQTIDCLWAVNTEQHHVSRPSSAIMPKKLEETRSNFLRDKLLRRRIVRAPAKIRALTKQTQRNPSHCRNGDGEVTGWERLTELNFSRNHTFQKVGCFVNLGSSHWNLKYKNVLFMNPYINITGILSCSFVSSPGKILSSGIFILLPPEGKNN